MSNEQQNKKDGQGHDKEISIIVNGRPKPYSEKEIDFRTVVKLAFPDAIFSDQFIYTVTYSKGEDKKPKGSLLDNDSVHVKDGMIFNVTRTDKS